MYADGNPKTKKQLKEMVASGKQVTVFQPGGIFPSQRNGKVCVEGPHYPKPHTWYASCEIKDGVILKVK